MKDGNGKEASPPSGDGTYTPDDLIDLVRAIKFAHPEMSMKKVHKEISGTMANSEDSYAFLAEVKLDEVKKVWKKALKSPSSESSNAIKSEPQLKVPKDGVMKFYTVGDGSVKTLAANYSKQQAEARIAAKQLEMKEKYSHFFLDVPADMSGQRPHQALMNFNDNNSNKQTTTSSSSSDGPSDGREIFKIQAAQLPPGMEDMLTPMLLYDKARKAKTFLHPPSPDTDEKDDGGYMKIKQMIAESGTSGVGLGGQKAYFYGIITETDDGDGPNVVSIDTTELAPSQRW